MLYSILCICFQLAELTEETIILESSIIQTATFVPVRLRVPYRVLIIYAVGFAVFHLLLLIFLYDWCFALYSRIFHLYHHQHYGTRPCRTGIAVKAMCLWWFKRPFVSVLSYVSWYIRVHLYRLAQRAAWPGCDVWKRIALLKQQGPPNKHGFVAVFVLEMNFYAKINAFGVKCVIASDTNVTKMFS